MVIKSSEYQTAETFSELEFKLKANTCEVKFGPLNAIPKNTDKFPKPWVGEIDSRGESFKLFRVKGSDSTSDFSVHGKYKILSGQPLVSVKYKLHFTAFIGFAGLAIFVFAVFHLLSRKGIEVNPFLQAFVMVLALLGYGYTFFRELKADEDGIVSLINKRTRFSTKDEVEPDEEDEEED